MSTRLILCAPVDFARHELSERLAGTLIGGATTVTSDRLSMPGIAFELDWQDRDPRMAQAFAASADRVRPSLVDSEVAQIESHSSVLYLVSEAFDQDEAALATAQRGQLIVVALIEAGVLGVKCESSGIAHGKGRWRELWERTRAGFQEGREGDDDGYERAFAALVETWVRCPLQGEVWTHTCGLHLLGRPEVALRNEDSADELETAAVLALFAAYQCRNQAHMGNGEGFRISPQSPRLVMNRNHTSFYAKDDLFHNPWGTWTLACEPSNNASSNDGAGAKKGWLARLFGG